MYTILILFVPRYNLATMIHCPYLLLRFLRYDQFSTQLTFHTLIYIYTLQAYTNTHRME